MSKNGFLRIALITLLFACQATWTLAGTTGSVSGTITDQNGRPLGGASVTVRSPSQSQILTTGPNGFYSALNLSPDTYSVTVSKDGYDTAQIFGVTVQADQSSRADVSLRNATKILGRVTSTASASVVNRSVTGDLYAVGAQAINAYQGSAGGSETLYSQNSVVGSLPGVVRAVVGTGGGYGGQGQLSLRGGSFDQVGFELDGVPLNRGFDFYNGTSFLTNGLASLEVYTGGEPADAGRAMSGYINEVIQRGKYPGGGDFTGVIGAPGFNHTVQADVYGGSPNNAFTYFVSTLALNSAYNFGNRSDLDNLSYVVPANDPNCPYFNSILPSGGPFPVLNCATANVLNAPQSVGAYVAAPYASQRDTVANLHWTIVHGGLNDDVQALYVTGSTVSVPLGKYSGISLDPSVATAYGGARLDANNQLNWPVGVFYQGAVGQPYNASLLLPLTWPTAGGSRGPIPANFTDSQSTQYSIEKLSYTRALSQSSFLRLYGYASYSSWNFDQPINGITGSSYYVLHDNNTGFTLSYQNQLTQNNLLKINADYSKDLTLRYNYFNWLGAPPSCQVANVAIPSCTDASGNAVPGAVVTKIPAPLSNWSTVTPVDTDIVLADNWKPSDRWLLDFGLRFDRFDFHLMPLQITGPNGLAVQAEEQAGQCLLGYNYSPSDPAVIGPTGNQNCFQILGANANAKFRPGGGAWTDVSGSLIFNATSPRFGATYSASPHDVIRFSVGRYVQPPNTAFEEYRDNPLFGAGRTVSRLNSFYSGIGFLAVHNILPMDSTNFDLSFEHDFQGGLSTKITPFYRNTRNQVNNVPFNPASPSFVTGLNFGASRIKGVEFLLRKNRTGVDGLSGTLAATYTDSKLRFQVEPSGLSFIDIENLNIIGYNSRHGTNFPLLDRNGYYSPSFVIAPSAFSPSYDVRWAVNLNLDYHTNGFDFLPNISYQSGNPYGDPGLFPDPTTGVCCGPDPYTHTFDAPGSLKGPSWWTFNLGVSHDLSKNVKASILATNLVTAVHNQGYPWELPTKYNILSYASNGFYVSSPLGLNGATLPNPVTAYYGDNYYPYGPAGISPLRQFVFSISTKI